MQRNLSLAKILILSAIVLTAIAQPIMAQSQNITGAVVDASGGMIPQATIKIVDLAKGDTASVTSEMVGQAYAAGDPLAREVLLETVELLTAWLGNIVDLLDPDVLVMGGGVAAMLKPFFDEIKKGLPKWCVNPRVSEIPLVMAHYGADAGIAGGAALSFEEHA